MRDMLQKASIASVGVVLLKVVVGGMTLKFWDQTVAFSVIDPGTIAALLTPTLGAYVSSLHRAMDPEDDPAPPKPAPAPKP